MRAVKRYWSRWMRSHATCRSRRRRQKWRHRYPSSLHPLLIQQLELRISLDARVGLDFPAPDAPELLGVPWGYESFSEDQAAIPAGLDEGQIPTNLDQQEITAGLDEEEITAGLDNIPAQNGILDLETTDDLFSDSNYLVEPVSHYSPPELDPDGWYAAVIPDEEATDISLTEIVIIPIIYLDDLDAELSETIGGDSEFGLIDPPIFDDEDYQSDDEGYIRDDQTGTLSPGDMNPVETTDDEGSPNDLVSDDEVTVEEENDDGIIVAEDNGVIIVEDNGGVVVVDDGGGLGAGSPPHSSIPSSHPRPGTGVGSGISTSNEGNSSGSKAFPDIEFGPVLGQMNNPAGPIGNSMTDERGQVTVQPPVSFDDLSYGPSPIPANLNSDLSIQPLMAPAPTLSLASVAPAALRTDQTEKSEHVLAAYLLAARTKHRISTTDNANDKDKDEGDKPCDSENTEAVIIMGANVGGQSQWTTVAHRPGGSMNPKPTTVMMPTSDAKWWSSRSNSSPEVQPRVSPVIHLNLRLITSGSASNIERSAGQNFSHTHSASIQDQTEPSNGSELMPTETSQGMINAHSDRHSSNAAGHGNLSENQREMSPLSSINALQAIALGAVSLSQILDSERSPRLNPRNKWFRRRP